MENQNLPPDEQDIDSFSTPVQNFAFGGIANPVQRAMLRGSDKEYLGARQKELDAFEAQRLSYNDALTKYQDEVYNPYKAQTEAYNTAAQRYNEEVYNPYKTQYDAYEKAINAWNQGDRTSDYAGPAAPTLTRTFDMTAPKDPEAFTMTAPEVPFKVEDVQAYQQQAAERARDDAGRRSVAIDVVSDPDRFNFGSMSVSNRFMADGGEVKAAPKGKSAKEMLGEMDGGYEPDDAAILKMAQEISSKGKLTHAQIMEAVDRVAAAGRGGDELLAYLSPASVEILKKMGGSGSINPATGLHEFKGGVIGKIVGAIKRVFNPRSAAPAAAAAVEGPAAAATPAGPTAAELAKQLDDANKAREALASKNALELTTLKEQQAAALKKQQEEATAAQQLAIQNALKADADARAKAALPMSAAATAGKAATTPGLTAATALNLMYRSSTGGGVPTAELDKYGGYDAVAKAAGAAGFNPTPKWIDSYEQSMKMPESEYTKRNKAFFSPGGAGYNNPDAGSWDGVTPGGGFVPLPKSKLAVDPFAGLTASKTSPYTIPSNLSTVGSAGTIGQIDLGGPLDVGWSRYLDKTRDEERQGKIPTGSIFGQGGERTDLNADQIPVTQPTLYQSKGVGQVGQVGQVGDIGGINITGPAAPMVFGSSPVRGGNAATNPSNYFGMSQPSTPGINAGTTAIGSPDMPMYGAMNTMNAIGSNKNLSPTMLGGTQNAGVMTDRLGNRIYSPGMGPLFGPPGFAKGGLADVNEFNMADAEDEPINTDPAGSAQKMLADLTGPTQSVTQVTESPNAKSIKRVSKKTSSGAGGTAKGMSMEYEALTSAKDLVPQLKDDGSARSQMEALALAYKLRAQQATDKSRGLMRNTLGAPTLEQPTLTKGRLTAKRFEKGGEAKKSGAQEVEEPSILRVNSYATDASERMFPGQMGQDDQRDAARHMLAAATVARKFGPGTAEFLGKAHERMSNPESFFSMFGIGKPRDDYEMDVHNNRIGAELAARSKSQAELEKLVAAMAAQSQNKQTAGKPWTMSREQMQNRKGQVTTPPPEYRADGSPEEGEMGPAFVTPKSGKGRKEGEISKQLKSGDAYINMAKGVTELPYDIAGAPVDLATMLMRPFGYSTEKPVMGSDWIKQQMTDAKIRPEPPADSTSKGFYTAGELLSNLTNPAAVSRKVGPVVEKGVKAGAKEVGRQLDRAIMDDAGPLSKFVPQSAKPLYAVRPTGSTVLSGPVGMQEDVSGIDKILKSGLTNATMAAGQNEGQALILRDFWDKKARNYFTRQFGTPDDPVAKGIASKQIKGSSLEEDFPEYMIDQINTGKTRVKEGTRPEGFVGPGTPESRFFPKYPRAMDDFTARYDKATGLKGNLITSDPAAANQSYSNLLSDQGRQMARTSQVAEEDKMIMQGVRPEMINANVGTVTRSPTDYDKVIGDGTQSADALFKAYKEAGLMNKMDAPQKTNWINQLFGEGRKIMGKNEDEVVKNMLPENVMTAINKGEPIYDLQYGLQKPLQTVFDPLSINKYLASIPPREAANIRFEDAVKGALKLREQADQRKLMVDRIKSGKPVSDKIFSEGVSAPLLQIDQGPLEGFSWKRIEKREATVPEGAYVGHSVGGYETGGAGYSADKREGFGTGKWQVYTLRDNRNRPVNTVEVKMLDENTPVVTQIKGNGRASGNTAPETYDSAVLQFFQNYLKPARIEESDSYLTPLLQTYKTGLESTKKERDLNNLYRELGLE
jgi:hypothetical protein